MTAPRQLLLAGLLAGLALAGALALLAGATGAGPGPAGGALLALALPVLAVPVLGAAATRSAAARRRAHDLLVAAGTALAAVAAVLAGAATDVLLLGRLPVDRERDLVLAALGGTAVAALAAAPLVARARRLVPPPAAGGVLRALGDPTAPQEDVLRRLAEGLSRRLLTSAVEVWTAGPGGLALAVAVPGGTGGASRCMPAPAALTGVTVAGPGWASTWLPELLLDAPADGAAAGAPAPLRLAPATHGGELLGLLVVRRAPDAPRFDAAQERVLVDLASRLGQLLHSRRLDAALHRTLADLRQTNDELRASRSRLVATADAERRRLERDLHDGAQQHLVAMTVTLGLAADLLDRDPAAARELVLQTREDARAAVGQLRDLAHGLYPPLLLESGLGAALRALPARVPGLTVDTGGAGRAAPAVEAALYFCVLEALQNAGKHAPGAPVRVTLRSAGPDLEAEVCDDGPGLPEGWARGTGQGHQNMLDRVGAVGGTVRWDARPGGGTVVRLRAPAEPVG